MPSLYFDKRDRQLLNIVNDVRARSKSREADRRLLYPHLHPHGIKEMVETKGLRIAYAAAHLLHSLEAGAVDDRLAALGILRDEVVHAALGPMPKNTARVLLQIMKDLVRTTGEERKELELAHDFRVAAGGKPRIIRRFLEKYHLLEMPEAWNQLSFDDHVHDVNTKGRKSSSHLIMDAWIKGIRRIRVIYYNYLEPKFAVELLEAARIMGVTVKIGIEFKARFHDKHIQLIWVPRGFPDTQAFLCFLAEDTVTSFMEEGRRVSDRRTTHIINLLNEFNTRHRPEINRRYGVDLPPLSPEAFSAFVGTGQASELHLAEYIHASLLPLLRARFERLRTLYQAASREERGTIIRQVEEMNRLDAYSIMEQFLVSSGPAVHSQSGSSEGESEFPSLGPHELIERLRQLHSAFRITLNLTNLRIEDVIEILYDCRGLISRLELFNLKDYRCGRMEDIPQINALQQALNEGNAVKLKRIITAALEKVEKRGVQGHEERIGKLKVILHDIGAFKVMYAARKLKARIGSDSTGRMPGFHGMGLAVLETLPGGRLRGEEMLRGTGREIIPIRIQALKRVTYVPRRSGGGVGDRVPGLLRRFPLPAFLGYEKKEDWSEAEDSAQLVRRGNVITLGGITAGSTNGFDLEAPRLSRSRVPGPRYLNTGIKNLIKVAVGFIPAFATFLLTKDWWLLAYLGAPIWFGITGIRNVLQSVLGGGGIRSSSLLRWNDYVSWERITDSLLFTGFSVPLLDYVVKTRLLDGTFGVNTSTGPVLMYAAMALANGCYLSAHNLFRGLPKSAAVGNFFRSVLSIPIAVVINSAAGSILAFAGTAAVDAVLQRWAAIISKGASDLVAGVIEGTADRYVNVRLRLRDYGTKLAELFDVYARLEMLFPEDQASDLLKSAAKNGHRRNAEIRDLEKIVIVNALDMLYFWMYQPRAHTALRALIAGLSDEEREILLTSQALLQRKREVSLLLINGLVGKNFARPLAFYLDRSESYLNAIGRLVDSVPPPTREVEPVGVGGGGRVPGELPGCHDVGAASGRKDVESGESSGEEFRAA